jgi:hypothetical protein
MEQLEEIFFPSVRNPKERSSSADIIGVPFTGTFGKIYRPTY